MSRQLRIAHFTVGRCNPESANGVDRAVAGLSRAQARLGHAVSVFSVTGKEPLPISGVEVHCYRPRCPRWAPPASFLEALWRFALPDALVSGLLAWRPDVVHLHSVHIPENIALGRILERNGIPYGVTIHGGLTAQIRRRHRSRKLALKVLMERRYLRSAAFLHGISTRDQEGIKEYGLDKPVTVIANGLDVAAIPVVTDAGALGARFPAVQGRRVFMFVGRLDVEVKGLDLLCHGFARARPAAATLVLTGPDQRSQEQELRALCSRLGITEQVIFTGPSFGQCKYDLLAGADVFVHPSRTEGGIPFSVLEAAVMGKPCLVTPAADPSGLLARCGAGIIVPPDSGSIAYGISQFMAMEAKELRGMGAKARRMVENEFEPDSIAARVIASYDISSG